MSSRRRLIEDDEDEDELVAPVSRKRTAQQSLSRSESLKRQIVSDSEEEEEEQADHPGAADSPEELGRATLPPTEGHDPEASEGTTSKHHKTSSSRDVPISTAKGRSQQELRPSGASFFGKSLNQVLGRAPQRQPGLSRRSKLPPLHANRKDAPPPRPRLPPPKKVKKTRSEWSDDGSAAEEEERRKRENGEDEEEEDEDEDENGSRRHEEERPEFQEEVEAY